MKQEIENLHAALFTGWGVVETYLALVKPTKTMVGSGCGSVGRAVTSDNRGRRFESSHRQKFIYILNICLLSTVYWKDENKEKEAGNGPFLKKKYFFIKPRNTKKLKPVQKVLIGSNVNFKYNYNKSLSFCKLWPFWWTTYDCILRL